MEKKSQQEAGNLVIYGLLAFFGGLLLLMSFSSPYWLQSYEYSLSPFKNMGLWEFCFDGYSHHRYQFVKKFSGCHYIFHEEFRIIREWFLPGWLMAVQAFISVSLIPSFIAQFIIALLLIRYPSQLIKFDWIFIGIIFILELLVVPLLFFAIAIFGGKCWERDWLIYPNYNYLSWSYWLALCSMFLHASAAFGFYLNYHSSRERRYQNKNLVMQMQAGIGDDYI